MPRVKKTKAFQQKAKAAQRGNANNSSHAGRNGFDTSFLPFDGTSSPRRGHNAGFTLQEEARNTERHQSFWNTDQRLRHNKVQFVSAGKFDPRELDAENALAKMSLDSPQEDVHTGEEEATPEAAVASPTNIVSGDPVSELPSPIVEEQPSSYFVVDTQGEPLHTELPLPQVRATSPTPSNSSEEVILFGGRDRNGRGVSRAPKEPKTQSASLDAKIRIVEDKIHEREELLVEVLREKSVSPSRSPDQHIESAMISLEPDQDTPSQKRGRRGQLHRKTKQDEDEILADYIANMDDDNLLHSGTFHPRELGGEDEIEVSSEESIEDNVEPIQGGWGRSEIDDFDELSTSDEAMGGVQEILSKRKRASGVQYLVVWENHTTDDARWVPVTTLMTAAGALSKVELFEAAEKLVVEFQDQGDEDTSDEDDSDIDLDDAGDDDEDDADLLQRRVDRMSDEQIARILAKQEELGIGGDEVLLFGDEADAENDLELEIADRMPTASMLDVFSSQPRGRGARRPRGDFPSATAMADAYDGFDVMDFDRPSLKKKPKGRKGKLVLDLSDSELEAEMQMAFENDRVKKKERKQEREELRAQGLLGKKNGKPDMKQKYKEGMGIHEVKEEIKRFLMGDNTTLALPPMDKADRKIVHELANAFNLKSKSVGGGKSRFPILTKTQRTPRSIVDDKFNDIEARLTRRFFPRMDVGSKKRIQRAPRGGNNAGVSYRDGDIVGGSAPELGVENRGRAMLEKMGWSTGTALGALNNKGILQPVSHVVKTTKAGLG